MVVQTLKAVSVRVCVCVCPAHISALMAVRVVSLMGLCVGFISVQRINAERFSVLLTDYFCLLSANKIKCCRVGVTAKHIVHINNYKR